MKKRQIYVLIISIFFYVILSYKLVEQIELKNMIISRESLNWGNLGNAWFPLVLRALLLPMLCFAPFVKSLNLTLDLIRIDIKYTLICLLGIYIIFSFYSGITPQTVYDCVVYLIFVGLSEEIIFRGIIYNVIKLKSYGIAVIISGSLWGMLHYSPEMMVNGILGGVISGWLFVMLYETSGSLWVPILIHAIWDVKITFFVKIIVIMFTILFFWLKKSKWRKLENES